MTQIAFWVRGFPSLSAGRSLDGTPGMEMGFLSHQQTDQRLSPGQRPSAPLNGDGEQNQHFGINRIRISLRKCVVLYNHTHKSLILLILFFDSVKSSP
ncbi:hypothetical protein [Neorhizobium galegae]|uniref:hypothetical protein n=1 Tax=Neorhizobium galegae TaxID=399 RepID=UPI001F389C8D|nr:hypothetical protein [Neorhizobium galegae]UIK06862.1 hypothetical protein LZK81_07825 [Neorhizobium galegae]